LLTIIEEIEEIDPDETLSAMKKMFTRTFIKKPYASIRTDGGVEFKGAFDKFCYDNSILHNVGIRGRHQQQANVESLHRQLSRLFNGYMNSIEIKTGKSYRNWTDVIDEVRTQLNKFRHKKLLKDSSTALPQDPINLFIPKEKKVKDKKGNIKKKLFMLKINLNTMLET
jgi:hypothetical protein